MKGYFTLLGLTTSLFCFAQTDLIFECPPSETVACMEAIPPPNLSLLVVSTDCGVDFNGNPIDTTISTGGNGPVTCDTVYVDCYSATSTNTTTLANGSTRVEIEITYGNDAGCKHAISHVAFSLPTGVSAVEYNEQDTYVGLLGSYNVENTTNNPYYSIKFESNGGGFKLGTREVFSFTLPPGIVYEEANITIKAARNVSNVILAIDCESEPSTPVDSVINYETYWIYDYINPGGSGCIGDPIVITRSYGASDACFNSSSCDQEFYIESECVDGVPVGCGPDTSQVMGRTALPSNNAWNSSQEKYEVNFSGVRETNEGYYSITKIRTNEGEAESVEANRELGRLAPRQLDSYSFAHESIEATDSILVEWVGQAVTVSNTRSIQVQETTVYPNPGSDAFTINFPSAVEGSVQVFVYDQIGRLQQRLASTTTNNSLLLSGETWSPGIYRIQVIDRNGMSFQTTWIRQ